MVGGCRIEWVQDAGKVFRNSIESTEEVGS